MQCASRLCYEAIASPCPIRSGYDSQTISQKNNYGGGWHCGVARCGAGPFHLAAKCTGAKLDQELAQTLTRQGFTGQIESTLEKRLGRPLNRNLAEIGRLLWFDTITGLNDDNTCGGCHSPTPFPAAGRR